MCKMSMILSIIRTGESDNVMTDIRWKYYSDDKKGCDFCFFHVMKTKEVLKGVRVLCKLKKNIFISNE